MGGPSGGSTGGGGGGVGPAGRKKSGKYGTAKDAKKTSNRNETRKAVTDFVKGGRVTGAIIKGITKTVKKAKEKKVERKVNDSLIGTPDYQGDVAKKPTKATTPIGGNDNDNNPPPKVETKKSVEQPKVKAQMDNTKIKSKNITADKTAPTETEMPTEELTEDEKLLRRKRGRKTKTVLTSVTGDNTKATLSKKTLLGY